MTSLDLSKYASTVGTYTDADAAKATEDKFRPLEAGIHECVLVEFKKMMPKNAVADDVPQSYILANDPNWLMFTPVFENAAGQRTPVTVMMPLTGDLKYKSVDGNETTFPYKSFMDFVTALGFDPMEDERPEVTFMRTMTTSNGECLNSLVNAQVKVKVEWGDNKYVHPFYDFENKVYWLADSEGEIPETLNEPFTVDKDAKGKARWQEMATKAKEAGYLFEQQPRIKILRHDTVKNDLTVFFPKKVAKAVNVITKVTPKPVTIKSPSVATISKPPVATQPPKATKVIAEEALLEDDSMPVE